jgi:aminomethyltransferase
MLVLRKGAGGPKRKIIALEMVERGIARDGYAVLDLDGNQIGAITSGSPAPFLKTNIALALVPAPVAAAGQAALDQASAGQELLVQVRANRVRARQVPLPFYKRAKR